jgi:hypothetical protein
VLPVRREGHRACLALPPRLEPEQPVLERQVSNADGPANLGQKDRAAVRQERGERQVVVARVADLLSLPGGGGAAELPAGRDVPDAYGSLLEVGAERQPTTSVLTTTSSGMITPDW